MADSLQIGKQPVSIRGLDHAGSAVIHSITLNNLSVGDFYSCFIIYRRLGKAWGAATAAHCHDQD